MNERQCTVPTKTAIGSRLCVLCVCAGEGGGGGGGGVS